MLRIIFLLLLTFHGLIHLMGFAKAFQYAEMKQLTIAISKPVGLMWLMATLLFVTTAILFLFKKDYWVIFSIAAVVISQIVIILSWHDAKYGTIANIIILIAAIIGYGTWSYYNKYQNDVETGLNRKEYFQNSELTETDILHLPEPVKKYLRYTGSIGKPKVNNFKIEFTGKIRKNEQSEWMLFTSEQYNFMETPTRLFFMKAVMKGLPVTGYHRYKNGDAYMDIRLLSLFKVQYQDGNEMDKADTVTFFNDMCCMAPATLIDKRISWQETTENMVIATFTNNGVTITADLFFNEVGELINFKSNDRYNADAGKILPWATPLRDYKEVNGYKIAGYAETIYTYPDRDLCYGTFEVSLIKYNCNDYK
ncbi:DUF6544 family protein [Flavobacterium filum]|uniref:DUF6544 family protein n=1 Tax=Flavobacterium filum TaxID=370974 RepID=UPI0023F48900|nr:DUF6544 family protein [Flavobacterium filum]